jgi:capsule polysaccharide export protein KpsE/RkpR
MAITYTIHEGGAVMGAGSAAEVAEHVVRSGATYTVQGTAEEQADGARRVEAKILALRMAAAKADTIARFEAAITEIENGIRILRAQPRPDQPRIDWWTQQATAIREQIAQERQT